MSDKMMLGAAVCWIITLSVAMRVSAFSFPFNRRASIVKLTSLGSARSNVPRANQATNRKGPYLAVITEESACDSIEQVEKTLATLTKAALSKQIWLISIRVRRLQGTDDGSQHSRVVLLATQLMKLCDAYGIRLVVSSDWLDAAFEAGVHGIHVKEAKWPIILSDVERLASAHGRSRPFLGTSIHSIESARKAMEVQAPDYFFVGTCYQTLSHPDKLELEGPRLPGMVRWELEQMIGDDDRRPRVIAIGGIDEHNCHEPITMGADGVAVIRAVSGASDPTNAVICLDEKMSKHRNVG